MDRDIGILLEKYGRKLVTVLKREVRIDKAVASGDTVDSIRSSRKGNKVTISYDATLGVVNEGLRPRGSKPSSKVILQWMIDKNIRPRDSRNNSSSFAKGGHKSRNMKASAYLIARAIHRKGTIKRFAYRGTNVLRFIEKGSDIEKRFERELKDIVELEFELLFEQANELPIR